MFGEMTRALIPAIALFIAVSSLSATARESRSGSDLPQGASGETATGQSSAERAPDMSAHVEAGRVTRPGAEPVSLQVPASAVYVGAERFTLYDVADCEIHLFVEVDANKVVQKLYWVQFEKYLDRVPDHSYNYAEGGNQRSGLWNSTFWTRAGIILTGRASRDGSDTERVRALIRKAGYTEPSNFVYGRFVRLLDDPDDSGRGRSELMLIYGESMETTGFSLTDLLVDGRTTEAWGGVAQGIVSRGASAFVVDQAG